MRRILLILSMVFYAGISLGAGQPNIVVILADDLGYGDVRCLNPERSKIATPEIDRFASQGMVFTDAHTTSAVCTPSRYSLLTGRYNWRTRLQSGVLSGTSAPLIAADRLTLPALLKQNGYTTAAIGKWHLGMNLPKDLTGGQITEGPTSRGFGHFFGISASLDMPPYAWIDDDRFTEAPTAEKEFYPNRKGPAAPGFTAEAVLPTLGRKAAEWIRANKEKAFFLYLPLTAPHTPLNPTPEWRGKSGLGSYADLVMETDAVVGSVLRTIEECGLAGNTLVVMTSDNGCAPYVGTSSEVDPMPHSQDAFQSLEAQGHFSSARFRGHKSDVWEGGHRVPFIVRWPGTVAAGSKSGQMVCQVDLMATFADIIGATLPAKAAEDSFSLLPLLKGSDKPVRETLVNHSINGRFAIREGSWKLALCPGSGGWSKAPEPPPGRKLPANQLYDLAKDAGERENLVAQHPEIVERLTKKLEMIVSDGRSTPGPKTANDVEVAILKKATEKSNSPAATKSEP